LSTVINNVEANAEAATSVAKFTRDVARRRILLLARMKGAGYKED
jgi:hypothetical protein